MYNIKSKLLIRNKLLNQSRNKHRQNLNPYKEHRIGMDKKIEARKITHEAVIKAIQSKLTLPTIFSNWVVPLNCKNEKIINYILNRRKRDNWIHQVNSNLELGYRYP